MPKKKEPETGKDKAMVVCCVLGGLLMLVTVSPQVPWRFAAANPMLTSRFSASRSYSLFSLGNNLGQGVSWMKMRGDLCRKVQEITKANPINALVGTAATSIVGTGGAAVGCANWAACKDHAVQRCAAYNTLAITGLVCLVLNLGAAIAGFLVPVFKSMETQPKKKKDQEAAKTTTMITACAASGVSFLSTVTWVGLSDSTFKQLKTTSFFPYPAAAAGAYIAGVGVFLLAIGMACALSRVYSKPKEEEHKEEEYAEAMPSEAAALLPGMGMGGMGMQSMGPPGMGPPMMPM